jgi:restriction system protein
MATIELAVIEVFDRSQFDVSLNDIPTTRGFRHEAVLVHKGLMKQRSISSTDQDVLNQKVRAQIYVWDEAWKKQVEKNQEIQKRDKLRSDKEEKKSRAAQKTNDALKAIENLQNTLKHTLTVNDAINWDSLKGYSTFKHPKPQKITPPAPALKRIPKEPVLTDPQYIPKLNFLDKLFSSRKALKIEGSKALFQRDQSQWEMKKNLIESENVKITQGYEYGLAKGETEYAGALRKWEEEKKAFLNSQAEANAAVDARREQYEQKIPDAIIDYCDMVLSNSKYPDSFPREWDLDYRQETKILLVDYRLPAIEDLPKVKEVKYIQSRDEFVDVLLPDSELLRIYDDLIYQIALRSLHELYEADVVKALDSIVLNGWVKSIDKRTGKEITPCIISVQANRDEFLSLSLGNVDPKTCFKTLKGVGSSKLHSLAPIPPILQMDRKDKRFVDSYAVADSIQEGDNLAAMDWEDFEHLIRELFEKEFAQDGAEVKVTRASRDAGVDAVVFNPDPLRGGKIVIQAKRYTNTVNVSAVRDLYGTVVNEGAIKGILVSTSDYGPDAYEFARDKPLTLLNGSNLLHLLLKHGHKAKIDLQEAKRILADAEKQKLP